MQYRGRPQAHAAGFRFPAWTMPAPARAAKDPDFKPSPPSKDRQKDPDAALRRMAGTGPKHRAVNTMAPTPVDIPEDPELRDNYFRALHGIPHPGDLQDEQDRKKARKQQERQEQEARLKAAREKGSGRAGAAARPPPKRGRLPPRRGRFSRWLDKFRNFARKIIGSKSTGSEIDSNLLDEALRTQLANNKREAAERMAAQAEQRARASAVRANSGRHSYEPLRKFTSAMIDTGDITQPPRAEGSKELIRQAQAADQQAGHQLDARDREAARVQKETVRQKSRLRRLRWFKL